MSKSGDSAVGRAQPGELMRLVAGGLTGNGLDVRLPESQDGRRLAIGGQGGRCVLSVEDTGYIEWECRAKVVQAISQGLPGGRVTRTAGGMRRRKQGGWSGPRP